MGPTSDFRASPIPIAASVKATEVEDGGQKALFG
jgi:hypothetical protein